MLMLNIKESRTKTKLIKLAQLPFAIAVISGLGACGSSDEIINTDYSKLSLAPISGKTLVTTDKQSFSNYIKNGIRLRVSGNSTVALAEDAATVGSNSVEQSQFSTTNVHELGVDEDDRIKFDGTYVYVSEDSYFPTSAESGKSAIRILQTDTANAHAEEVARIERDDELKVEGLYLHQGQQKSSLVSIARSYQYYSTFLTDIDWHWASGKTEVQVRNVSDPVNPELDWKIEIEGNLEGSRKIGDKLYLLTRYIPEIEGINYNPTSLAEKISTEKLILETPISDLLPHYQLNDGAIKNLVNSSECLLAEDFEQNHGYADVITLTAINLTSLEVESSTCLNANVQGIYSSTENFYIGASGIVDWSENQYGTSVHKFALEPTGVTYRASGFVKGWLGWQDPSFRMGEQQEEFRIVTTDWSNGEPEHFLTILEEREGGRLQALSQIPNAQNPEPIGKPGEDIFAVRFIDDKAYIVTFERIDPLYQIDLSDPSNPVITSSLEMPGVARYLHPIIDNWLLGIGHEAVDGLMQGIKVELYDIRNPAEPRVVDTQLIGQRGTWSEAINSLKAVSVLQLTEDSLQIALPITRYQATASSSVEWQDTGLYVFEINGLGEQELSLSHSGVMLSEQKGDTDYPIHWGNGRSVLTSEAILYLQGNQLLIGPQGEFENSNGPF